MKHITRQYFMAVASLTAAHLQNAKESDDGKTVVDESYLRAVLNCFGQDPDVRNYYVEEEK